MTAKGRRGYPDTLVAVGVPVALFLVFTAVLFVWPSTNSPRRCEGNFCAYNSVLNLGRFRVRLMARPRKSRADLRRGSPATTERSLVRLAQLTRKADQVRTVGISDGYLADAPDLLDFVVNEVGAAPIAGDQWPVAWDRFLKRGFDIIAGSLLLLVLSPVALILSVLVKLRSPGPVLFRQERVGQGRQLFTIYKFRTMAVGESTQTNESETGAQHASIPLHELRNKGVEAERITRIGGFMRRTGLDEIPQFLNVLLGNMSLVGPRPFTECESETFTGWQARRFELRPGITGLWQVSGRNDLSMDDLRRLDYLYVASWSVWWDVKIVWDTPRAMVRGFGAY